MDDSFQLSITQVNHAPQGTGKPRRGKPGHPTFQLLMAQKRSGYASKTGMPSVVLGPSWSPKPKWTNIRNGVTFAKDAFDFQKELVEYCESDVRLLKQGCLTFKRLFEAQAGFNPFDQITIASACNRDLRMNRMIPNSIASKPIRGWKNSINRSNVAIQWPLGVPKNIPRTFNMPEMPARFASQLWGSWMVTATTFRPCTNFRVVSPMDVPRVVLTVTKHMCGTMIEPCKMSTKPSNTRSNS